MGRISTGIGLISGINTSSLIQQLMQIESQPVTDLKNQVTAEQASQKSLQTLQSQLSPLLTVASSLTSTQTTQARSATSSNPNAITATAQPGATLGSYQLWAVQQASTQQMLSTGFADAGSTAVGAGTLTVKFGGFVANDTSLGQLNGGAGVQRGQISITDRSGATAAINLSTAQTIGDVVNAINSAAGIRVHASLGNDGIVLADQTGASASNLTVQNLGGDTTASDLGLAKSVGTSSVTGDTINRLAPSLNLNYLNDGNGVRRQSSVPDFRITAKDGTTIDVSLGSASTVQDVLNSINNATGNGGKVVASIGSGGSNLVLTDTTGGGGTLSVGALNSSQAASDLGIVGSEQSPGVLTGGRILAGLGTTLLKDLNGGSGAGTLGDVQITDRTGVAATIHLSGATTVSDVVNAINAAGIGVTASVNSAGDGIRITDTTTGAGHLQVADLTGNAAATLHLTVDAATSSVNSGDLNLRYISQNTTLASLNNGQGISAGKFIISNKAGNSATIDLTGSNVKTMGDVMQAINTSGINVSASINATGDGILITDNSSGSNKLQITDLSGTSAAGLHLAGSSNSGTIDGALRYTISIGSSDTLSTVVQSINNSGAPLSASILNDGSTGSPYRLMLTSKQAGAQGRLLVDTGSSGVQLSQVSAAANAILGIGQSSDGAPAVLLTSTNNTFTQVASNLTVTLQGVSSSPISLNVATDTSALVNQISNFISNFNTASQSLTTDLDYDTSTNKGGPLHGDVTALQVQTALNDLFGYRSGNPDNTIQSLSALGITYKDGQLSLDSSILNQQLQSNAAGVQDFFSNANVGFAKKMTQVVNQIADPLQGSITIESNSIDSLVTSQQQQITFLNAQLSVRQAQLQESFNNMESVLASLQSSSGMLSQLANLAQLAQLGFSSSSSGSSSSSKSG